MTNVGSDRLEYFHTNINRFLSDFMFQLSKKRNGKLEIANCDIQFILENESLESAPGIAHTILSMSKEMHHDGMIVLILGNFRPEA